MSDKAIGRRKPVRRIEEEEVVSDGFVMRLAENVFENPAMSGGLLVMAMTAAAIVSNAMFLQSARHPDPLFMTRPSPALEMSKQAAVPIPRPRLDPVDVPPAAAPVPAASAADAAVADPATVAKVQRALTGRGFYRGTVDGIPGSQTRAAIVAYEKAEGMPVTGTASVALLDHLRTAAVKPVAVPPRATRSASPVKLPPAPIPAPAAQLQPAPSDPIAAVSAPTAGPVLPDPIAAVAAPEASPAPPQPLPAAVAPVTPAEPAAPPKPDPAAVERQRYMSVQNALNQIGYGPVPSDGTLNDETANAIRRFELDNGLPITGKIGNRLVDRLVAIGAMKAT